MSQLAIVLLLTSGLAAQTRPPAGGQIPPANSVGRAPKTRIVDHVARGKAEIPKFAFAHSDWIKAAATTTRIQAQSDLWFRNPTEASKKLAELNKRPVAKWDRSQLCEGTVAITVLRELGKPIDTKLAVSILSAWNRFKSIDFVEYRWATYLHANCLPNPYLLAPLKRLDNAVPDNYLTQRHIILMSGARSEDIEFGLALGKNYSKKWADYSAAQVCYATILWDKARKTKRASDFDVAIAQMEKAKRCPDCDLAYKKVIDLWIGNIQFTKKRDAKT